MNDDISKNHTYSSISITLDGLVTEIVIETIFNMLQLNNISIITILM